MRTGSFFEIALRDSTPLPLMSRVEGVYLDRFGDAWDYQADAWKRLSRVFERLDKGGHVLDVGAASGQFANCLAWSGEFSTVTAVDVKRFGKYIELSDDIRRYDMSVGDLSFADDAFDVVVCMEVLEHVPDDIFETAIAELRRVCRGQLVVTVPYQEPEPLADGHVRRFEDEDFLRLFPDAAFAILRRPRKPWMLIQERFDGQPNRLATDGGADNAKEPPPDLRERVAELEAQVAALRGRKVVRTADLLGRSARRLSARARRALRHRT